MGKVCVLECRDYNYDDVINMVHGLLDSFEELKELNQGKMLIKTNLLKKNKPEDGVTTHPYVVEGVVRFFQNLGHDVMIGDSPGGPFNPIILKGVYEACGILDVAKRTNAKLNYDTEVIEVKPNNSMLINNLKLVKAFTEVDYVVSCGKLKTHTMMTYTGAVKNLFGMIPGVTKADYHLKMNDPTHFANMLIDVCEHVNPIFSILDGIEAMEGDGPSSGDIRNLGLLLGGTNPHELDYIATYIAGLDNVPTVIEAKRRGLLKTEDNSITLSGVDVSNLEIRPFKLPGSTHVNFVSGRIPKFVESFLLEEIRPYPLVKLDMCIGCGVCVKNCPPKVIRLEYKKVVIDTSGCIRCFCCHELCPEKAIGIKRHPLHKLVFGK